MKTENRRKFIIDCLYFAIIAAIIILLLRIGLPVLAPFVIGWVASLILRPAVKFSDNKMKINKNIASIFIVFIFYVAIIFLVVLCGIKLSESIIELAKRLPELYTKTIEPGLWNVVDKIKELVKSFPDEVSESVLNSSTDFISNFGTTISNFSMKIISLLGNTAISVPGLLFDIIITVVSTVFLCIDGEMIWKLVLKQFSDEKADFIGHASDSMKKLVGKYISSYAIIMGITFVELLIGFLIIGVQNAALIALLIAVFDILPIVGSGLIIVPWAVISLITGSVKLGIGLFIVWAIVIVIRYIMEPKIVGDRVGLHPLVTLMAMVAGTYLFGGIGILLLPLILALLQNMNAAGIIHLYKPLEEKKTKKSKKIHFFNNGGDFISHIFGDKNNDNTPDK